MPNEPDRIPQYFAALGATMGGFSLGTVIGWVSPASKLILEKVNTTGSVTASEMSWVSSIMTLGAASSQIYMGLTLDVFGRKLSMLISAIPFIMGWLLLAFASTIPAFLVGRFITGFCGGSFCVAAPCYIGEIADKNIRGALTVCFQLLLVIGILLSYTLGEFGNIHALTLPLILGPATLFVIFLFLPESPVFLYKKGKVEKSQKALQFFRGKDYDISSEMKEIDEYTKSDESFWEKFKTRACIKAFIMLIGMHTVQQLSGINSVMFFAHTIFTMAGTDLAPGTSAIILGVVQVILTFVSAVTVDRAGRKMLWVLSLAIMGTCLVFLGMYFSIKRSDEEMAKRIGWLPLILVCTYIAGFSLATGPLPWVMLGEFLPNAVKGYIGSFATFFNWVLAFAITFSFEGLVNKVGADVVFWGYAVICGAGIAFVILFVIETKNKTLEEIQTQLGTPPT